PSQPASKEKPMSDASTPQAQNSTPPFTLGAVATDVAGAGYRVVPLPAGRKAPPPKGWLESATFDVASVDRIWGSNPNANVGIATGETATPKQDAFVLDQDGVAGAATIAQLSTKLGALPETYEVTTGRSDGGRHRYYRVPSDENITIGAG